MNGSQNPALRAQPALVEIVERRRDGYDENSDAPGEHMILPNEVRINGVPLLVPVGEKITVHQMDVGEHDVVQVTLTLFARRVVMAPESAEAAKA